MITASLLSLAAARPLPAADPAVRGSGPASASTAFLNTEPTAHPFSELMQQASRPKSQPAGHAAPSPESPRSAASAGASPPASQSASQPRPRAVERPSERRPAAPAPRPPAPQDGSVQGTVTARASGDEAAEKADAAAPDEGSPADPAVATAPAAPATSPADAGSLTAPAPQASPAADRLSTAGPLATEAGVRRANDQEGLGGVAPTDPKGTGTRTVAPGPGADGSTANAAMTDAARTSAVARRDGFGPQLQDAAATVRNPRAAADAAGQGQAADKADAAKAVSIHETVRWPERLPATSAGAPGQVASDGQNRAALETGAAARADVAAEGASAALATDPGLAAGRERGARGDRAAAGAAELSALSGPGAAPPDLAAASGLASANGASTTAGRTSEAAVSHRLEAAPGSVGFGAEVGTRITTFALAGVQHARLELNPAEMGPVTVQIQLDGQAAQVHLAADHPQTRHALEQSMPQLAAALRDAGLTLSGGGVFEQPRPPQQGREGALPRQGSGTPAGGPSIGSATTAGGVPAVVRQRGLVDLVA